MTAALRTAHATARSLGRQLRCPGQDLVEEQREKFGMALIRQVCYCSVQHRISRLIGRNYASSYLVRHCRFSCRLRRESTTHLSITWTIVLGFIGSIIGGAVTHLFY